MNCLIKKSKLWLTPSYIISSMKEKAHAVVVLPGLGDQTELMSRFFRLLAWERRFGLSPVVFDLDWKNQGEDFAEKVIRLSDFLADLYKTYNEVSLLATSAGGCVAIALLAEQVEKIHKVVLVCSRLVAGSAVSPTLETAATGYPAFYQGVLSSEQLLNSTSLKPYLAKILTVSPRFGDSVVPPSTARVEGTQNITFPSRGHSSTIIAALALASEIPQFLLAGNSQQ